MERYLHNKASIDLASIVLGMLGFDSVGGREGTGGKKFMGTEGGAQF